MSCANTINIHSLIFFTYKRERKKRNVLIHSPHTEITFNLNGVVGQTLSHKRDQKGHSCCTILS